LYHELIIRILLFFDFYKELLFVVRARKGRASTTSFFLAAHFAKRNTKNCGGEKRSGESEGRPHSRTFGSLRGKQKFSLFACPVVSRRLYYGACPSVQFGARLPAEASAQAGSAPSIPLKKGSDFVKQTHPKISRIS
jgi:hypothetical protein